MTTEVRNLTESPYRYIVMLTATFPDGSRTYGTGALIGRNDILTATHVVYSPALGGWATGLELAIGIDYNNRTNRFESQSLVELDSFRWTINAWPQQTYTDGNNNLLSWGESQYDVALVGISKAIGDTTGWFGLAAGYNSPQWAYQIGYPSGSTGMMLGKAWIEHGGYYSVYNADIRNGSDIMGPGSSGGPLYVYEDGSPYIIGVKSSGSETYSTWADIGMLYSQLLTYRNDNDSLLSTTTPQVPATPDRPLRGSAGNDRFTATASAEHLDGLGGLDRMIYNDSASLYRLSIGASGVQVIDSRNSANTDWLYNIERIQFSDATLALDLGAGEIAGSAYRLYQAAFDREPDNKGLSYWIARMDEGRSLNEVAAGFTASDEFARLYGQGPSPETLLTRYYANVLERQPDSQGMAYWLAKMSAGMNASEVLAQFSESTENLTRTQSAFDNGLWLS